MFKQNATKKCFKQGYWVFQLLNREQNTNLHYPFSIPSSFIWMYTSSYHVQHEAGHFLVAYLLGVLPKGYTITSLDTLSKQGSLNVQAGTAFVDYEFLEEVSSINFWRKKIIFKFLDYSKTPPSVFHLNVELAHILSQWKLDKLVRHLKCLDFF